MIAAAGSGERLGAGGAKAFVELAGRPLVEWSLEACRGAGSIGAIVVAVPPGEEGRLAEAGVDVVTGAATRSESVAAALLRVQTDLVVVHDAARPLVTHGLIDAVVEALTAEPGIDGVVAAAPVADTVKEAGDDRVIEATLDRSRLWAAQTPQAFRTEALRQAHESGDAPSATDDAMLVEGLGRKVLIHEAPAGNLKVTTVTDLEVASSLLGRR